MKRQICGESNAAHLTAKVLYDDDGYCYEVVVRVKKSK